MEKEIVRTLLLGRLTLLRTMQIAFQSEPTREELEVVSSSQVEKALLLFAPQEPRFEAFASLIRDMRTAISSAEFIERAQCEYSTLFVGPPKPAAPFWESVYLDERELLFLASTSDVRMRYAAEGYEVASDTKVAEDAIHYQFDFIACMAQSMHDALEKGAKKQFSHLVRVSSDFEADHMATWLPIFAQRASASSASQVYAPLCELAAVLIEFDRILLDELVEDETLAALFTA